MSINLLPPGLLCCAGNNKEELFAASLKGDQSGIRPVNIVENRRFLAGLVHEAGAPIAADRLFRITAAALEQIHPDAERVIAQYGPRRVGVCAGSCDNGSEASLFAHKAFFSGKGFPAAYSLADQSASLVSEFTASFFNSGNLKIEGPVMTIATACASGAGAIVKGAQLIESGICDAVIAGGADIVSQTVLLGFASLEAVSDEICNPFSKNRKGITLGEGAAFFILEKDSPAAAGSRVIELSGWGESADAHHMTAPRPDGAGALAAMRDAVNMAGIAPKDVGYINLHGTATPLNDSMEALAVDSLFADNKPPVSSTKPITGHTLGAAGAIELALCWMALSKGGLPAHCWDGEHDEKIPRLNFAGPGTTAQPKICMSNSFAFGGCNTSIIISGKDR